MPGPNEPTIADLAALFRKQEGTRKAASRRGPQRIGNVIGQVLARRGYAHVQTSGELAVAWSEVAGPLAVERLAWGRAGAGRWKSWSPTRP